MRKDHALDAILPKTRQGILAATLLQPEKAWYVSELARRTGVPSSSLQRKLRVVFIYGSIASGHDDTASDIDLLVIGDVSPVDVAVPLRKAKELLGRTSIPASTRRPSLPKSGWPRIIS